MDKKRKIYLAFDVDGTIYDSESIVVEAFKSGIEETARTLGRNDIKVPDRDTIMGLVGMPTSTIFATFFPMLNPQELTLLGDSCNAAFVRIIKTGGGQLINGAYETLRILYESGYVLLPASNGRRAYVESIFDSHKINLFFADSPYFVEGDILDKSAILAIYKKRLGAGDLMVMIGDREADRAAAYKNNLPFIGCAFGYMGDREVRGERWVVNSFYEIPTVLKELEREFL